MKITIMFRDGNVRTKNIEDTAEMFFHACLFAKSTVDVSGAHDAKIDIYDTVVSFEEINILLQSATRMDRIDSINAFISGIRK